MSSNRDALVTGIGRDGWLRASVAVEDDDRRCGKASESSRGYQNRLSAHHDVKALWIYLSLPGKVRDVVSN